MDRKWGAHYSFRYFWYGVYLEHPSDSEASSDPPRQDSVTQNVPTGSETRCVSFKNHSVFLKERVTKVSESVRFTSMRGVIRDLDSLLWGSVDLRALLATGLNKMMFVMHSVLSEAEFVSK